MAELTDEDRALLDFESDHRRHLRDRETEVRTRFGVTLAQYHEQLNSLLDRPEALAHAPAPVRRLRRLRQRRVAARRAGRLSA
jgi:hypothetical protein